MEGRTRETFFFRGVFSLREGGFRGDFSRVTFLRGEIFFGCEGGLRLEQRGDLQATEREREVFSGGDIFEELLGWIGK